MSKDISRRTALKWIATGTVATTVAGIGVRNARGADKQVRESGVADTWEKTHDRTWLGGNYWANPMEDWCIADGAAECLSVGGQRSVHSLTHQLTNPAAAFTLSVILNRVVSGSQDGGAGFRIGARSELNEYRSNCFAENGVNAGVLKNQLILGPNSEPLGPLVVPSSIALRLSGVPDQGRVTLTLDAASTETGASLGRITHTVPAKEVLGNVALVSNFHGSSDKRPGKQQTEVGSRYRFSQWVLDGDALTVSPGRRFGPILWSMYTLSDSRTSDGFVLKLSALTGPLGAKDNQTVELHAQTQGSWQKLGEAKLDPDAWIATFRIPAWDEKRAIPFKLVYREKHRDGTETPDEWTGTIQANPVGRPMRMAAMTCQNDYAFPYEPVARNVARLKPDLVFFSGDQIYENHGGFGYIREPADLAIHNYLRKFYQFGWAFREVMRSQPTLCLPDDHDVLQGNLWGEGGAKMLNPERDPGASSLGGYVEPPRMVNVVHRTNTAHHPDPFDPTPCAQGISSYYGDMVYGGVGFAIIADRQWKSGPESVHAAVGETGQGEDPLYINPAFDDPKLSLLGERQEAFLKQWSGDWRGHTLKAVLSQTVFAGLSTHQPLPDRYLKLDFDSGGWPHTPRNRAVELMRPSMALHICGDTHLATISQYGVEKQRDSNWAFCTPAIAAGWPRWWHPDAVVMPHANRPKHDLPDTGEYQDSFGNLAYVYAVGNPVVGKSPNRYEKAHEKGSGFGFIIFDPQQRTYTIQAFRFLVDATDDQPGSQFPGWPLAIHQTENRGENRIT